MLWNGENSKIDFSKNIQLIIKKKERERRKQIKCNFKIFIFQKLLGLFVFSQVSSYEEFSVFRNRLNRNILMTPALGLLPSVCYSDGPFDTFSFYLYQAHGNSSMHMKVHIFNRKMLSSI